jgi:hypothetical protein
MLLQGGLWAFTSFAKTAKWYDMARLASGCFLAIVSISAAAGFLVYGGRLFLMLRRFPIESRGRRKKLREVGLVTTICATCFTIRYGNAGRASCRMGILAAVTSPARLKGTACGRHVCPQLFAVATWLLACVGHYDIYIYHL